MSTAVDSDRSTTISPRVVEKIALRAARQVPGVIDHSSGLGQFAGRSFPRVSVHLISDVRGQRVAVDLDVQIATRWPAPTVAVAQLTREVVAEWVEAFTGMTVHAVNVDVGAVVPHPELPDEQARITLGELEATPRIPLLTRISATPLRAHSPKTVRGITEPAHPPVPPAAALAPVITAQRTPVRRVDAPTEPTLTAKHPVPPDAPTLAPVPPPRRVPAHHPIAPAYPTVTHPVGPQPRPVARPVSPHSHLNPPVTSRVHTNHRPVVSPPPQYGLPLLADVHTPAGPLLRAVPTPRGLQPRAVPTPQGLPVTIHPEVDRHGLRSVTVNRHPRITPTVPRDRQRDNDGQTTDDTNETDRMTP